MSPGEDDRARLERTAGGPAPDDDRTRLTPAGGLAHPAGGTRPGAPPRMFGRYQVVRELGRGGMGVVLQARDPVLGRDVAIKVMETPDADALARFRREASALGGLRHAGIVEVYDVGVEQGRPFVVMELVAGESLEARLRREDRLHPRDAVALARDVARALGHAHQAGVVHRDVKPGNVLVGLDGRPRLVDFGVARIQGSALTRTGTMVGTPEYMAPEQTGDSPSTHGPPTDVYALGALLYRSLTGRPPLQSPAVVVLLNRILNERPAPPSAIEPGVDARLDALVLRCLEKAPADRFADGDALAAALDGWLRGEATGSSPRGALIAAGVGLALVVGVGLGAALGGRGPVEAPPPVAPATPPAPPTSPGTADPAPLPAPAGRVAVARVLGPQAPAHGADSPRVLAVARDGGTVLVGTAHWEAARRRPGHIHRLRLPDLVELSAWRAHDHGVSALLPLPDGRLLSGGNEGDVALWSAQGAELGRDRGGARVAALLEVEGAGLVAVRQDGACARLRLEGDRLVRAGPPVVVPEAHVRQVIAIGPGTLLASTDQGLRIVDLARPVTSRAAERTLPPGVPAGQMYGLARRPADGLVAAVGEGVVCVIDLAAERATTTTELPGTWSFVAWSGERLVLGGHGVPVRSARVAPDSLEVTFSAHEVGPHDAEAAVALPDGDVLTGAAKGLNRVQRGEAQAPRDEPDAPFDVLSLALSPDGHVALVGTGEEAASAHRYDLRAGVKDPPLRARLGHIRGVGVAPDGALLVCARSGVGNVALWRAGEEWPSHMAEARFGVGISAAALSPDGRVAVLGGESGELETWALSPQLARTADLAAGPGLGWIHDLAFADDRRVLCASPSGLTVWDVQRGRSAGPEDRGPGLTAVAPVPGDDGRVVVGTPDGEVLVRTLARTAPATRLRAHERPVSAVGVSSDGALAASVSEDGWLHVSALDGRRVGSLDLGARGDRGTRLAFRPGAPRTLLVGTARGALLEVEVSP